jgi:hypothetical protein
MKRRGFMGLFGRTVALVTAAPALAPIATAHPAPDLERTARKIAKARELAAGYGANPALVFSEDGRRLYQQAIGRALRKAVDKQLYMELSTPFDVSTAVEVQCSSPSCE